MTQTKAELLQTRHQGDIRLGDADSSHYVGFKAPATVGSNLVWTLPATDGSANQFLQTNASGVLSWGTADTSASMPKTGGIFTGDVTFDGATAGRDIVFDRSDNALEFADNAAAKFGDGGDLSINHDGSNSYIDVYTNNLLIRDTNGNMATFVQDGAVNLYFDNSLKFATTNTGIAITGAATISTDLTVTGDLTVSGTTTTINTQTLDVEDKNIVIGKVSSPSDSTANGGGITLKGNADIEWKWVSSTGAWTSTEGIHLPDGEMLRLGTDSDLRIFHNGSNSIINDSGTGTLQLQLGGSTKLEIVSGGATVTGVCTATSFSGSGANLTNLPASGGSIELTAGEALTAGDRVIANSSGNAVKVAQTVNANNPPTIINYSDHYTSSNQGGTHGCYESGTDRYVKIWRRNNIMYSLCFHNNGASGEPGFTEGNETNITGSTYYSGRVCPLTSGKVLMVARKSDSRMHAWVGTITAGTTNNISWNSLGQIGSITNSENDFRLIQVADGKAVMVYQGSGAYARATCVTVSGSSMTVGNETQISSNGGVNQYPAACWDSTNSRLWVSYEGNVRVGVVHCGISGTTITVGTRRVLDSSGNNNTGYELVHDPSANRTVLCHHKQSPNDDLKIYVLAISGSTFTNGSVQTVPSSGGDNWPRMAYLTSVNRVILSTSDPAMMLLTVGSTSVSFGTAGNPSFGDTGNQGNWMYDPTHKTAVGIYGGQRTYIKSWNPGNAVTNSAAYIGCSSATYSSGATATIDVSGGTNNSQSGLTAGQLYYVSDTGSLTTTKPDSGVVAGVSLSSTKILIK